MANWCNHNIDLLVIAYGALVLACVKVLSDYLNIDINTGYGFWVLLLGVVTLSIGISALVCYRVLLKRHGLVSI